MGESDWILPVLGLGGLAIGGLLIYPKLKSSGIFDDEEVEAERNVSQARLDSIERALEDMYSKGRRDEEREDYEDEPSRVPLLIGAPADDAYVITDEDFDKLDIGKKDRSFLNRQRKLRDARLERVVYGDNMMEMQGAPVASFFVNTVSPYGQGPSHEFIRLPRPEGLSNTNTRTNTVNLY